MNNRLASIDTLIFTGGVKPAPHLWKKFITSDRLIIAADSGLECLMQLPLAPQAHYVVGDFDSLTNKALLAPYTPEQIITSPTYKDETDTELALKLATQLGAKHSLLIGGGEGRSDHFLATLCLLAQSFAPAVWLTAHEFIIPITSSLTIEGDVGDILSFYPLKMPSSITSCGLEWSIDTLADLTAGMSLSNQLKLPLATVHCVDGCLVLIKPFSP
jgi:thiamine pyrophosphokinase